MIRGDKVVEFRMEQNFSYGKFTINTLEVNFNRVSELMSIHGNSFKVPTQIVPEVDGSGKLSMTG